MADFHCQQLNDPLTQCLDVYLVPDTAASASTAHALTEVTLTPEATLSEGP